MNISEVFGFHAPFLQIVYRSAIVYVAIIVGLRLSGRRQLGQMTPFDLVLVLLIANAVQNAMVGTDASILGGLLAAGTLLLLNLIIQRVTRRFGFLGRAIEGVPVVLISDGALMEHSITSQGFNKGDILQALREHGFDDPSKIHLAVLEVDGTISIVPFGAGTVRTRRSVRVVAEGS